MANRSGSMIKVTDPRGSGGPAGNGVYYFRVPKSEGERGVEFAIGVESKEPSSSARPFVVDLFPFNRGLGPGRQWEPGTYVDGLIDTSWNEAIYQAPAVTSITLTSAAAQGIKSVTWNGSLWVLAGTNVYSISSSHSVTNDRSLGVTGTWISVVGNELFICCGSAGRIQKRTAAGSWSTSSDVYAHAMEVVRDKVWKVGNSTAAIDNNISSIDVNTASLATACGTLANWNTAADYRAGDDSYQAYAIYDYRGEPYVGRPDGMFAPDPETKFWNQTPQLAARPSTLNCKGAWVGDGYLWIPTARELLRHSPSETIPVGPETTRAAYKSWRVTAGVHTDKHAYVLATELIGTDTYVLKMENDPRGDGYIFTPLAKVADSSSHYGKWIALNQANGATLCFGGGTAATSANRIPIGTGSGRDIDDSGYAFNSSSYLTTGIFFPATDQSTRVLWHGTEVLTGTTSNISITYRSQGSVSDSTSPSTAMLDTQEGGGSSGIAAVGRSLRYFAPDTVSSWMSMKLSFSSTSRQEILGWKVFGYLIPEVADEVVLTIAAGDLVQLQDGTGTGYSGHDTIERWKEWQRLGTVLNIELADYEEDRTTRFIVGGVQARTISIDPSRGGNDEMEWAVRVSLIRLDYANAYAS